MIIFLYLDKEVIESMLKMFKSWLSMIKVWHHDVEQNLRSNQKAKLNIFCKMVLVIILLLVVKKIQGWLPSIEEMLQNPFVVMDFEVIAADVGGLLIIVIILELCWQMIRESAGYNNTQSKFVIYNWIINKIQIHPIIIWIKIKFSRK